MQMYMNERKRNQQMLKLNSKMTFYKCKYNCQTIIYTLHIYINNTYKDCCTIPAGMFGEKCSFLGFGEIETKLLFHERDPQRKTF